MADFSNTFFGDGLSYTSRPELDVLITAAYPRTMEEVLIWASLLWDRQGVYSQAIQKSVRYFMTEIELDGDEDEDATTLQSYAESLDENFNLLTDAASVGDDLIGWGNSFTSYNEPFDRTFICPVCYSRLAGDVGIDELGYTWDGDSFTGTCPNPACGAKGKKLTEDTKARGNGAKPTLMRWPPQLIHITEHPLSKKAEYAVDICEYGDFRKHIKAQSPIYLKDTPIEFLKALSTGKRIIFDDTEMYHLAMKSPAVRESALKGWGLPRFMSDFDTVFILALLDNNIRTFLKDYVVPHRVLSPPMGGAKGGMAGAGGDFLANFRGDDFKRTIQSMVARHRRSPEDIHISPFPLQYQIFGGEASQMVPIDTQSHYLDRLMQTMAIPPEFRGAPLSNMALPVISFRMFERTWSHFAHSMKSWITWAVRKHGAAQGWPKVNAALTPASIYEDPAILDITLQMASAGEVSRTTAMKKVGLDRTYENSMLRRERVEAEEQAIKDQAEAERKGIASEAVRTPLPGEDMLQPPEGAPGAAPAGGMPPAQSGPGGLDASMSSNASLDELHAKADELASQIMQMDLSTRRSQLVSLKHQNETLHSLVKQKLENLEQQASQQGVMMARQGQM